MEIKVLGPGCANCKRLYQEAEKASPSGAAGHDHQGGGDGGHHGLRHPEDAGLVIDGKVVASGGSARLRDRDDDHDRPDTVQTER